MAPVAVGGQAPPHRFLLLRRLPRRPVFEVLREVGSGFESPSEHFKLIAQVVRAYL